MSLHDVTGSKRLRWYDDEPDICQCVRILLGFPPSVAQLFEQAVLAMADSHYHADDAMKQFKSLGAEKVLPLYQAQNKRRAYDHSPTKHRIMNYFWILPYPVKNQLAQQMIHLGQWTALFLKTTSYLPEMAQRNAYARFLLVYEGRDADKLKAHLATLENPALGQRGDHLQGRDKIYGDKLQVQPSSDP